MSEDIELPKDTKASKKSKKVKDGDSVGESEGKYYSQFPVLLLC